MDSIKYIGLDVHQSTISVAILDGEGKLVMQCVLSGWPALTLDANQIWGAPFNLLLVG
jgi:hypothetical protein